MKELHTIIATTLKEDIVKFISLFDGGLRVINEKKNAEKKEKMKIFGSIVKSKQLALQKPYEQTKGKIQFPDMAILAEKDIKEIKKFRVTKIGGYWDFISTIQMTFNDG